MSKKGLYVIIGGGAVLLIAGALFYLFFFRSNPTGTNTSGGFFDFIGLTGDRTGATPSPQGSNNGSGAGSDKTGTSTSGTTAIQEKRLLQIISKAIIGPSFTKDGMKISYFVRAGGNLEQVTPDGKNPQILSPLTVLGIFDVLWNPLKERVVVSYFDGGIVKRFISNVGTSSSVIFLPQTITSFSWSPDGKSLAYLIPHKEESGLAIATADGKNPRVVYSTPIPDLTVMWGSKNTILLPSRPSGGAPGVLFAFNTDKKTVTKIFDTAYGLTILPSPKGTEMLVARTDERGQNLALSLADVTGATPLALTNATLPEKCVFSADAALVFCAVPKNLQAFSVLPDNWYMGNGFFDDRLVKIDTKTHSIDEILNEGSFDAVGLFLSPDNKFLYFQNKKDDTLWRLKLVN